MGFDYNDLGVPEDTQEFENLLTQIRASEVKEKIVEEKIVEKQFNTEIIVKKRKLSEMAQVNIVVAGLSILVIMAIASIFYVFFYTK